MSADINYTFSLSVFWDNFFCHTLTSHNCQAKFAFLSDLGVKLKFCIYILSSCSHIHKRIKNGTVVNFPMSLPKLAHPGFHKISQNKIYKTTDLTCPSQG